MGFLKDLTKENVNHIEKSDLDLKELLRRYKATFTGLGCLGEEYELQLQENAVPTIHPPRRVPLSIKDQLKTKLEEMVN